jgi:hypothetical protein
MAPRLEVEERFLFHRIHVLGNYPSVNQALEAAVLIFAYAADTPFLVLNDAPMRAEIALNLLVL